MSEDDIIKKVALELGHSEDAVRLAYRSQFRFIIDHIRSLPLNIDMSKEDFDKLTTNFSLLDLGKLYCTWENVQKKKLYFRTVLPKVRRNARKNTESNQAESQ